MPHPVLFLLALIDIFSGIFLFFHPNFLLRFVFYLGIISLMKGGWSLMTAFAVKFYFDILGYLDTVAGISLLLLYSKITYSFFAIIGLMMIAKGLWSIFFSIST